MKNGNINDFNAENRKEIPVEMLAQVTGGGSELPQMPKCIYCRSNQYVSPKGNAVYWCDFCKKMFKAHN